MEIIKVDPRSLVDNPDRSRQTKSTPQADALLLASIKAVGIVQPPTIYQQPNGGNGWVIDAGHRRSRLAIAAGLEEIDVIRIDPPGENGAMRSLVENLAREVLSPVDLWRAIERLVALEWTEDAIAIALALTVRRVKQIRLCAKVAPAMLDHIAKGDMPNEQQLRTIASASVEEQKEVWKKHKPTKADPKAPWPRIAQGLTKVKMWAKDASFGDDLAQAYGIQWLDDLFAPADQDSRYTIDVEAYLGAQQEWMSNHLPKRGIIAEVNTWGQPVLPPKAERTYSKPTKSDHVAMYIDRSGMVQSIAYRMPPKKEAKGKPDGSGDAAPTPRPDVTRKGMDMIGDFRTDALHEALARTPIENDTLMALLILAFAGMNVSVSSASESGYFGHRRFARHATLLFDQDNKLALDHEGLNQAARKVLIDVLSCRSDRSNSGFIARLAGEAIGASSFLPNMGTEDFLNCLSRTSLEASCKETPVQPRPRVRETRAELVKHFSEGRFVHPSALFAPETAELDSWLKSHQPDPDDVEDEADLPDSALAEDGEGSTSDDDGVSGEEDEGFRDAAE